MYVSDDFITPAATPSHRRRKLIVLIIVIVLCLLGVLLTVILNHSKASKGSSGIEQSLNADDTLSSNSGDDLTGQTPGHNDKAKSGSAGSTKNSSTGSSNGSSTSSTATNGSGGGSSSSTKSGGSTSGGSGGSGGSTTASKTLHYTANIGSGQASAIAMGFNLLDMGPTKSSIDALPNGVQAMVWLGNLDNAPVGSSCPAPGYSYSSFTAKVDALKNDSKVFGYYIADEPHPSVCPSAASDIKQRADYIHAHAPGQIAYIVVLDGSNLCGGNFGCEYAALNPSHTHVDYIGIDPYPCHYASNGVTAVPCDKTQITSRVNSAISNGIPASIIVPTFQTFGQAGRSDGKSVYYRLPTTAELTSMLNTWHSLVPNPAFDYAYSFGVQCGSSCPAPQAIANEPAIQAIIKDHNK